MNKCLLDMDGVIVDFIGGACEYFNKPIPDWPKPNVDIAEIFGIGSTKLWESLSDKFWENLKPTEEYLEIIDILECRFSQENICILTSPTINPACAVGKIRWIEKNIPKYRRQYLIGPRKHFCAAENHLLVDDNIKNCEDFKKAGGNAFLVPRPWNGVVGDPVNDLKGFLHE